MNYREIVPCPALDRWVQCFWILDGPPGPPEAIFPDGRSEIIFHFADPFRRFHPDGSSERQPRCFLVGQMSGWARVGPAGAVGVFGIRFSPAGAAAFIGVPQSELADRFLSLDLVCGRAAKDLEQQILEAASGRERVARAEAWLLRRLRFKADPLVEAALDRLAVADPRLRIHALARTLQVSPRRLERRFLDRVGLTPKLFSRIVRFQNLVQAIRRPGPADWAGLAFDCGYFDQAHLIRDFRQFAGQTPSVYCSRVDRLSDFFVEPLSDFSKTGSAARF